MEIVEGESQRVVVDESTKTAEARRLARKMAAQMGLDAISDQMLIVVTEACTNLLKHATRGELVINTGVEGPHANPLIEVMALDQGPGIRNLNECLQDGYSTQGTAGHGLGAIVRLSKHADFYSMPGKGTAVLARWGGETNGRPAHEPRAHLPIRAVNLPKPGQEVSGDSWAAVEHNQHLGLLVADGLGHGREAHLASSEAVRVLRENPDLPPKALLERCHQALRSTRGAAVAVASIDHRRERVAFAGVGNISGRIYSGSRLRQNAVSVNGTAGHQCERMQEFYYPWPADGVLQLNSDGITSRASLESYPGLALRDPALMAGVLYRDFVRGSDDSTVVIVKAA